MEGLGGGIRGCAATKTDALQRDLLLLLKVRSLLLVFIFHCIRRCVCVVGGGQSEHVLTHGQTLKCRGDITEHIWRQGHSYVSSGEPYLVFPRVYIDK